MHLVSAVIITYNEEKNIARCIEALQPISDEIIIIDSFSSDNTIHIAEKYNVKIIQQKWLGYGPQKRFAVSAANFNNIIAVDADETLDQEAINQIRSLKQNGFIGVYEILLYNFYFGKCIKYGEPYPKFKQRIFCREFVNWNESPLHESLVIPLGYPVIKLKGRINHYSYPSIDQYISKANAYSKIAANHLYNNGKRNYLLKIILSPIFTFFKGYIIKLGFLDGLHGFVIAWLNAHTNFLKYAKLWALNRESKIRSL